MALTEVQLPDKASFYADIQGLAGEIVSRMLRWQEASEFIAKMGTTELDAMGVATGQVRVDLANFRGSLDNLVAVFNGESVTPTVSPSDAMDAIRKMLVI